MRTELTTKLNRTELMITCGNSTLILTVSCELRCPLHHSSHLAICSIQPSLPAQLSNLIQPSLPTQPSNPIQPSLLTQPSNPTQMSLPIQPSLPTFSTSTMSFFPAQLSPPTQLSLPSKSLSDSSTNQVLVLDDNTPDTEHLEWQPSSSSHFVHQQQSFRYPHTTSVTIQSPTEFDLEEQLSDSNPWEDIGTDSDILISSPVPTTFSVTSSSGNESTSTSPATTSHAPPLFPTAPKLQPVHQVLSDNPGSGATSLRNLATNLSKCAVFGKEEMSRCSLSGRKGTATLSDRKMSYIKALVRGRVSEMSQVEF